MAIASALMIAPSRRAPARSSSATRSSSARYSSGRSWAIDWPSIAVSIDPIGPLGNSPLVPSHAIERATGCVLSRRRNVDLGIRGRRALVGGGSTGLGRAVAERLAGEGCAIALWARHDEALEATA